LKLKYIFKSLTMPKIEKDRSKTGFNQDWSKAVQSGLWRVWNIYRPVLVLVLPKIGKKLSWSDDVTVYYTTPLKCVSLTSIEMDNIV